MDCFIMLWILGIREQNWNPKVIMPSNQVSITNANNVAFEHEDESYMESA